MGTPQERAKGLLGLVREHADESESQRHLKGEVARAFAQEGLFRIAAPVDFFGSEEDPVTQIETIETVAYVDGSAAVHIGDSFYSLYLSNRILFRSEEIDWRRNPK